MEAELNNTEFLFYRQDRPSQRAERGGGVIIGVNKKLVSGVSKTLEIVSLSYEQLYISVVKNHCKFIVGAYYIPEPNVKIFQDISMYVQDLIDNYVNYNFILIGDFNLPKVMWFRNNEITQNVYCIDTEKVVLDSCNFFVEFMKGIGLRQINTIRNDNGNTLDNIYK